MSTDLEEIKKMLSGITTAPKTRASLMTGINSAGQQYFQTPYNIPSTFGEFYVGSPTSVMSDFVALPLDFMEDKISGLQADYDVTALKAQTQPDVYKQLIQAAPYNEDARQKLIQEYGLDTKSEEWAKKLAYDPMAAKKIAQEIIGLGERFKADKRTKDIGEEYEVWSKKLATQPYQSNWTNFIDRRTGQFIQLDPSQQRAEYIEDKSMDYLKTHYLPNLKANIKESIINSGNIIISEDPATGLLKYRKPGSTTIETIDPQDPNNTFVQNAINNLAAAAFADPNAQISKVLRDLRQVTTEKQMGTLLSQLLSPQFYRKETIEGVEESLVPGQDAGKGRGSGGVVTEETPFYSTTVPQEKVTKSKFETYSNLKSNVINNTQITENNQGVTRTPYRTVQEVSTSLNLPANYFLNTPDGQLAKAPDGNTFILKNEPLKEDILGRNSEWGPLNLSGSVDYSFVKYGNDLIPTISNLTITEANGNVLSEDDPLYKSIRAAVVIKNTNDIAAKKDLEYIENETAKRELALFKKKDGTTLNKVALTYVTPKYTRQDVEDPEEEDVRVQYVDKKTGQIKTSEEVQKETSDWLNTLSDSQLLTIFRSSPNEKIADEVTKKYAVSPNASTKIISFSQPGKQRTAESTSELSRAESDLVATWGYYDENGQYKGNKEFLHNALRQATIINDDGTTTTLAKKGIASKEDYEKFKTFLNYGGIGFSNGKPYYYGSLQFNEPDPKWIGDVRYLNGARVKIPISALPEIGKKFVNALSVPEAGLAYANVINNAMSAGKSGVLIDIDKDAPWVKGASSITWNRPTYASEGQGGAVYVDVTFKEPQEVPGSSTPVKSYRIRATDALDAGLQLHDLNAYYLYQDAFNNYQGGTGGSSTGGGKPQLGARK